MHGDLILYVICNSREEQEEWITLIQDCKYKCSENNDVEVH